MVQGVCCRNGRAGACLSAGCSHGLAASGSHRPIQKLKVSLQPSAAVPAAQTAPDIACACSGVLHGSSVLTSGLFSLDLQPAFACPMSVTVTALSSWRLSCCRRYQGVWQLDKTCWEARLEEARTQESSVRTDQLQPETCKRHKGPFM